MVIKTLPPAENTDFKDKSVLVTGGASGLGLHTVNLFANSGAYVTIADIQDGSEVATRLTEKGHKVQYVHCNVKNYDSQAKAFRSAVDFSPNKTLDVVAAYAGRDIIVDLVDYVKAASPEVSLESQPPPAPNVEPLEVNTIGPLYTATLALHYFRLQPSGGEPNADKNLIIVSSMTGYIDYANSTAYTASKYGSRGLFRAIRAKAKADLHVRVNLIAPWGILSPMTAPLIEKLTELGITVGKGVTLAKAETLVGAVARIVSDKGISGRAIAIMPEGAVDIGDDVAGGYGGPVLQELMELRKRDGDFLTG